MDMDRYDDSFSFFNSIHIHSFSFVGGVTLKAIMVQLQCIDACLDTFSDELCQVNTCVGCIARQQACLGGFIKSPSLSPEASKDKDDGGDSNGDDSDGDDDEDEASSFFGNEEMTASQ